MTVEEFLIFVARMRGYDAADLPGRVDHAIDQCFLHGVRKQTIETLSKGYRQRNCMAQAILHDPPVLILDEPTDGLDPNQKKVVRDMIKAMSEKKVIIFSTHVLEEVNAVCDRAVIISEGKIVADSDPADLRKRSRSYNAVSAHIVARSDQVESALVTIPDVERVEVAMDGDQCSCTAFPRDQQPIAAQVIDAARERGWLITQIETDGGRLDDVFRDLTTTQDVAKETA
jgi:ABC-2 type transport system ATP-binding protein